MDLPQFLEILESRSLWFSRMDDLEDPLEAGFTDGELDYLTAEAISADEQNARRTWLQWPPFMRITSFVSCWRAGQDESMAMWDLYGKPRGSIAIKSTIGSLKNAPYQQAGKYLLARSSTSTWIKQFLTTILSSCVCEKPSAIGTSAKFDY